MLTIEVETDFGPDVSTLLESHYLAMHALCPPETMYALDLASFQSTDIDLWVAKQSGLAVACCALKRLSDIHGELKSLRTDPRYTGKGLASKLLKHILSEARLAGYTKLSLETGSASAFAPAVALFEKLGFSQCGPFASYQAHPTSLFFEINLSR